MFSALHEKDGFFNQTAFNIIFPLSNDLFLVSINFSTTNKRKRHCGRLKQLQIFVSTKGKFLYRQFKLVYWDAVLFSRVILLEFWLESNIMDRMKNLTHAL